jgi:hypothetical protein
MSAGFDVAATAATALATELIGLYLKCGVSSRFHCDGVDIVCTLVHVEAYKHMIE